MSSRSPLAVSGRFPLLGTLLSSLSILLPLFPAAASPPAGDEGEGGKAGAAPEGLKALGLVKKYKSTGYHTFAYVEGKEKLSAFLKIPEDAEYLMDARIRLEDLAEGESVWVFGRLVERETADGQGRRGTDRQLQNISAIVTGKDVKVDESFKDSRVPDAKWHRATVSRPGAAIWVKVDGDDFKVVLRKNTPILRRLESPKGALRSGAWIEVAAKEHDGRPDTRSNSDAKKPSYLAEKVILIDPGFIQTVYPMLSR